MSVQHTRLRLEASQLNSHLFKIGIKDTPKCSCGSPNEDAWHFFFTCPSYAAPRSKLHTTISRVAPFTIQTVLYGFSKGSLEQNIIIFSAAQAFISETGRFKKTDVG